MATRFLFGVLGAVTAAGMMAACGSGEGHLFTGGASTTSQTTGTNTNTTGTGGTGGTTTGTGTGGCTADAQCGDAFDCTVDICDEGTCTHLADSSMCPSGSFCEVLTGCIESTACATDEQCTTKLGGD